ncbi:hypothetical protein K435DRAFT_794196 [Dendrothele bispora CBS 962.96]|uniref:Uncharacterized protein n=1 Tax=Dendrothele bispora (strain CBS 962.96) TaxID=1314807 RepID=A0A4V4HGV6_DENBC|nr:hypothetical protein K435DRAFT_794196 [Dendrothele bispora CBS 962.96]
MAQRCINIYCGLDVLLAKTEIDVLVGSRNVAALQMWSGHIIVAYRLSATYHNEILSIIFVAYPLVGFWRVLESLGGGVEYWVGARTGVGAGRREGSTAQKTNMKLGMGSSRRNIGEGKRDEEEGEEGKEGLERLEERKDGEEEEDWESLRERPVAMLVVGVQRRWREMRDGFKGSMFSWRSSRGSGRERDEESSSHFLTSTLDSNSTTTLTPSEVDPDRDESDRHHHQPQHHQQSPLPSYHSFIRDDNDNGADATLRSHVHDHEGDQDREQKAFDNDGGRSSGSFIFCISCSDSDSSNRRKSASPPHEPKANDNDICDKSFWDRRDSDRPVQRHELRPLKGQQGQERQFERPNSDSVSTSASVVGFDEIARVDGAEGRSRVQEQLQHGQLQERNDDDHGYDSNDKEDDDDNDGHHFAFNDDRWIKSE